MAFGVLTVVMGPVAILLAFWSLTGYRILHVQSSSMDPMFSVGDAVLVDTSRRSVTAGDIVSYTDSGDGGTVVSHRVVDVLDDGDLVTKGDANVALDDSVPAASVVGLVTHRLPYAGIILQSMRSWPVAVALVYVPAVAAVLVETRRMIAALTPPKYVLHR